jgi:transposase
MAKGYRPVLRDQPFLLPVDMREWLPAGHLVWFVLDVVEQVDTSAFRRRPVKAASGRAGFDPQMLLALLLYGYCRGVRSSRQIERLCEVDVAFRVICAADVPDHSVIARFRQAHQRAFAELFVQVLRLAARAGLGRFGTIAIDGTKIAANASVDANRTEAWLRGQVEEIITEAQQTDTAEDAEFGARRGDEPPDDFADPDARAAKIRAALAEIEAERRAAEQRRAETAERQLAEITEGRKRPGRHPAEVEVAALRARLARLIAAQQAGIDAHAARAAAAEAAGRRRPGGRHPAPVDQHSDIVIARTRLAKAEARAAERVPRQAEKTAAAGPARANLTDPGSRLMPTRRGWVQGYNVQVAVTDDQLIVATGVGQNTGDMQQFVPMLTAAEHAATDCAAASGRADIAIETALADAGYASEDNLTAPGPDRLIAVGRGGRQHHDALRRPADGEPPPGASPRQAMAHRLRTPEGMARYKRRGATVEPAIGNLKKIITRFSGRGLQAATAEIDLAASAFNLLKIHRAGPAIA